MESKWLALGLIAAGCAAFYAAYRMNATSSFEGGSFMGQIVVIAGGVISVAGGLGILLVEGFKAM
jgi:hypothetical protein